MAIVEYPDGVACEEPEEVRFIDERNSFLHMLCRRWDKEESECMTHRRQTEPSSSSQI